MFGSRRGLAAGRMSGLGGAGPPRPQPAREMGGAEAPQVEFAEDSRSQAMSASSAEGEDQDVFEGIVVEKKLMADETDDPQGESS